MPHGFQLEDLGLVFSVRYEYAEFIYFYWYIIWMQDRLEPDILFSRRY
jgi:hypothetical protein